MKDIALMFCYSRRTIERRLYELGMRSTNYTHLSDRELDSLVERIVMQWRRKTIIVNVNIVHNLIITNKVIKNSLIIFNKLIILD